MATDFTPSRDWESNPDTDDYSSEVLVRTTPHGVFRAKIERDTDASEPYFFAGCPVIQIDTNRGYGFTVKATGYGEIIPGTEQGDDGLPRSAEDILTYFHERTGYKRDAIDLFERYLHIFHDGNLVEYGPNQNYTDYTYVAYVTRTLWETWGNKGEVGKAEMDEYVSWLEGDVYGVMVERATSFDEDDEPDAWTEIPDTDVWGHYGETWAKQAAEEALADEIKDAAASMLPTGDNP